MGDHLFRQCCGALLFDQRQDYESAIRSLTDHLRTNPGNAAAYHNRIAPEDPYLRRARAHCRAEAGDLVGAAEDFSRAIAVQPEFAPQYLDRAAVYERLGQASLAAEDRATATWHGASPANGESRPPQAFR